MVHKGSHLLDQLNWNSFSRPISVIASGGLDVYKAREDAPRRCKDCSERYESSHAWDSSILGIAVMRSAREGRKFKIDPIDHKVG